MIRTSRSRWIAVAALTSALGSACSAGSSPSSPSQPGPRQPGAPKPDAETDAVKALRAELARDRPATAQAFLDQYRSRPLAALPYDPSKAQGLSLLGASKLALSPGELTALGNNGLVISATRKFPTFFYGYESIYADHLPLFVSADSILYAVHRSYDKLLISLEEWALRPALSELLAGMHGRLAGAKAGVSAAVVADVDEYLTVGRRLLGDAAVMPMAGGDLARIEKLVTKAAAAGAAEDIDLFGESRSFDFSQFKPRGHYAGDPTLEKYFRASMWLGRTDLRLVESTVKGPKFNRRQFEVALLLARLVTGSDDQWTRLDESLRAFVGESDNMRPGDFAMLAQKLGVTSPAELSGRSDGDLMNGILAGGFGIQRIASQILAVPPGGEGLPLGRAFLLLGQRYVIDSNVLASVVYDRVAPTTGKMRLMPSALDVGFAALGNRRAAELLSDELSKYENYPAALSDMSRLVDKHEPAFWQGSLYHSWMSALRALSPAADTSNPKASGLPALTGTEQWARRLLNTQLASWAELRHDTLLYAKQSYTGVPACEFPDAYVEPAPAFWKALGDFARRGNAFVTSLGALGAMSDAKEYFAHLEATVGMLEQMAVRQRDGQPFTAEQMAFINETVEEKQVSGGCVPTRVASGWYTKLFYRTPATEIDPTIADVHTQPADEIGNPVGKVLHVATGSPRLMVVTFDTCNGPRAYVGLASAYHEKITMNFERLDDKTWAKELPGGPADVPWLDGVLVK